jgi:hypothetical protein
MDKILNREVKLPASVERTRRIAVLCGILGCVMLAISIIGLMSLGA